VIVEEFIGLDVGEKRTGLARGSTAARLAEPLQTVKTADVVKAISGRHRQQEISGVVVGLPRNSAGEDTAQTSWIRDWVVKAKNDLDLPFYWQDEALTTKLATSRELAKKVGSKADKDAVAAALILQDFLDTPEAERVVC
jgi:putative holliday junction resolvase